MGRLIARALGILCLVIGVLGILTPIPFGIVFFTLACLFLIPTSPTAVRLIRGARRRSRRFDAAMSTVARKVPSPYRRILRETDLDFMDRHSL